VRKLIKPSRSPGDATPFRVLPVLLLLTAGWATSLFAQGSLSRRFERLLGRAPFDRASWGVLVVTDDGRTVYQHNADRLFIPASTLKLAVSAAATVLLPPDFRITTAAYGTGPLTDGTLQGDLVIYGRGDPSFGAHCYGPDTLTAGVCDGSYFEPTLVHPEWETYDLNWWYAAPVSGLGFNDNSVNITWKPGGRVGAPADVALEPYLSNFSFENRSRTGPPDARRTLDFFRQPDTPFIWAQGVVPLGAAGRTEYFALPHPNMYFVRALRTVLQDRGVSVGGPTLATTDSTRYRAALEGPPLATIASRPVSELIYPLLNESHNWFAEMLLKLLGKELGTGGSWEGGTGVVSRFLIDSVGVDSTAFDLHDGSGLSRSDLISPRAIVAILRYMRHHSNDAGFLQALPHPGTGTLSDRLLCTPVDGRLEAKTGSLQEVNALAGYLERPKGSPYIFDIVTNNHTASYASGVAQIDSLVLALADGMKASGPAADGQCAASGSR
jgi:D-alanyl-D-alanine carboxypeptidase/D-alanyl-D-alanine-endopeptidase (penicillin-binding protein 4)